MTEPTNAKQWKQAALTAIEDNRAEWIELLSQLIRRPSDNPPGDTTTLAAYITDVLTREGLPPRIFEPLAGAPNIVVSLDGAAQGRHLILNGHLDQFPVEEADTWALPPYSGQVVDGRIYGRGAADMKGGTTALLAVTILLKRLKVPLAGKLTLTLVSDEETGGRWGAQWLVENRPELRGDAVLNAEPTSTAVVAVAEKGICWLRVTTHAAGGHAGASSLDNAVYKMCTAIQAGLKLRGQRGSVPESLRESVKHSKEMLEATEAGKGAGWVLDGVTLNVGTIQGGCKANVVPALCVADFDFRLPVGIAPDDLQTQLRGLLRESGLSETDVEVAPIMVSPPSHTEPTELIVQTLARNAEAVTGRAPHVQLVPWGSDCRFWRWKGIPAALFGPRAYHMGAADEHITLEDYITTMAVHAGAIIDYLGVADQSKRIP
jgi:succinyl-diaminopimelate desuccinylase